MDFSFPCPSLTLDETFGTINFLHFLQKLERISGGIVILNFILIPFIIRACFCASLGFFLALSYLKKSRLILFLTIIFVILFLFWSHNMQIVRAFLATSIIPVIIYMVFFYYQKKNNYAFYIVLKYLNILLIIILTVYHLDLSIRNNPYGYKMLTNSENRFNDNNIKALHREIWDKYIKSDFKYFLHPKRTEYRDKITITQKNYFTINEAEEINKIFSKQKKIYLYHNITPIESLHTIFKNVRTAKVNNAILNEILIDSKKRHNICYISKNKIFNNSNYKLNFLSKSGFKIYCNFELK